jgi:segregation and condensation protein B
VDVADPDAEALAAIPLATRVEAALFAAPEPLPVKRLRELTGCPDPRAVREALETLAADYAAAGRAFRIEEVAQGFQLRTSETVAAVVARMGRRPAEERLSAAALETLAVVAYRQPVLRADVEKIRGVACGEVLRALQERGLVRVAGRAELPGSPLLYGTTQRFLEIFGLRDIQDLPKDRELLRPREA